MKKPASDSPSAPGAAAAPPPHCLFCAIAERRLDAHVVAETDSVLVFLDKTPVFKGHCLVVPKAHAETLVDLPRASVDPLMGVARGIARAVELSLGADGTFVAMNNRVSQSVAHLHVHVVPRRKKDGLRGFFWPRVKYASADEMADFAAKIAAAFDPAF
ncbi:MAG: HIT family protein [Polyangiaceae bacterium]